MGFSDSAGRLGAAIWGAPAIGTTALYDAIVEGLKRLQKGSSDKKVLIVISDGGDNASKATSRPRAEDDGTIECHDLHHRHLRRRTIPTRIRKCSSRLAHETGGEAFFPAELSETVQICERIARDIRDQYTIGYSSMSAKKDGTYHKVRLTARAKADGKLSVRTRAGYSAGAKREKSPCRRSTCR